MPPVKKETKKDIGRPIKKYKKRNVSKENESVSNGKYELKIIVEPKPKVVKKGAENLDLHKAIQKNSRMSRNSYQGQASTGSGRIIKNKSGNQFLKEYKKKSDLKKLEEDQLRSNAKRAYAKTKKRVTKDDDDYDQDDPDYDVADSEGDE